MYNFVIASISEGKSWAGHGWWEAFEIYMGNLDPCPGTPDANLAEVWARVEQYFRRHAIRQHYCTMKLSMFCNADDPYGVMPKLKGRAIEVRSLMPALANVWRHYMDIGLVHHKAVLQGLVSSSRMDEILHAFPHVDVLPDGLGREFAEQSWLYCRCQNAAADYYNKGEDQLLIFDVTIKTHYTCHCALDAVFLNPRRGWNFLGEDFMKDCKTLMAACMRGNGMAGASVKFMDKYVVCLHLMFQDCGKDLL